MQNGIERLLRLTADYHNFCNDQYSAQQNADEDELCLDELDIVAAAAGVVLNEMPDNQK